MIVPDNGPGVHAHGPDIELTAAEFFRLLHPNADDLTGHLNVYTLPDRRSRWFKTTELDRAADHAVALSEGRDVYYGFGLVDLAAREQEAREARIRRGERNPRVDLAYIRGSNTTIAAIPGFCHDADILDPAAHKKTALPASVDEVLALYEEAFPGRPPTLAIVSGRGLHGYWLLKEAHSIETPKERDDLGLLLARFQATINDRGEKRHGWELDATADLAHVFRPPQTYNRKGGQPIPVTVLMMSGRRYDLEAFDDELIDVAWMPKGKADPVSLSDQLEAVDDLEALDLQPWIVTHIIDGNEEVTDDDGKPVNRFKSDSEAVWRVVNELAERGHDDDTIAAILLDRRYGISAKPLRQRNPKQWVAAELGRMRKHQAQPKGPTIDWDVEDPDDSPAEQAEAAEPAPERPTIRISGRDPRDVAEEAIFELRKANLPQPQLFVRGGELTRTLRTESGRPTIGTISKDDLFYTLCRTAQWERYDARSKDWKISSPSDDVVRYINGRGTWPFPALLGIAEAPVLRPDGTIVSTPGYDPATRMVYSPAKNLAVPPIPDEPTVDQVNVAKELIGELIADFRFDGAPSVANAIGLLFTLVVRPAISGPAPLAVIDKNTPGAGATLITEVFGIVAHGRAPGLTAVPDQDVELEKRVTTLLRDGEPFNVFDNVDRPLEHGSLSLVLTATEWAGRILGKSETARYPNLATWSANGNNVVLRGDIARRAYRIRLISEDAQPWRVENQAESRFRHPNLPAWASERRGDLLAAILTLARRWFALGQPAPATASLGKFEDWCRVIGGILESAGISGFLGNLDELYDSVDAEASEWEAFLTAWFNTYGSTEQSPSDIKTNLTDAQFAELAEALPSDLVAALNDPRVSFERRLGKALSKRVDRRYGERRLYLLRAGSAGRTRWRVLSGVTS
jgi:hypothetical protein